MAEAEEKLEVEGCGFLCVHEKVVEKVQHELPQEETLLQHEQDARAHPVRAADGGGVRVRPREVAGHDTIRRIAPIARAETGTAD